MRGYWRHPDETAAVISSDGWLRTGDIATVDAAGFLRIVDRKKDMIIVSGFKVFPNEIESVCTEHPAVLECGCIGVPDSHSGQAVKVFVVVRESNGTTVELLREHFRARLTGYKLPKYVEFRESLPKTNIGKILRRELEREESERTAPSADEPAQGPLQARTIGRSQSDESRYVKSSLAKYGSCVAEAAKAMFPMIRTHATRTHAAKRQLLRQKVRRDVIHRHSSGGGVIQDPALLSTIASKIVQRKRPGSGIDIRNRLIDVLVRPQRQQGPEDLLLHDPHLVRGAEYERWADETRRRGVRTTLRCE